MVDWDKQPLGAVWDLELAAHLKVSVRTVRKERSRRRIPALPGGRTLIINPLEKKKGDNWRLNRTIKERFWDSQPLGKISDREIAKKIGCSTNTVRYQRQKRNIAVYKIRLKCPICLHYFRTCQKARKFCSKICQDKLRQARNSSFRFDEDLVLAKAIMNGAISEAKGGRK